ncbi:type III-B CRISPR module-associated protein Cmr5 [Limisphaera sp. VF-2]|jgi:CRISPR-associated protein Cmr5|uniref:type III-B CRISPR module-associated protein Cmr5 n=1 Tax=Limisphaera sp. VF-2 TaxID=3400418 RepID=UPI0017703010
MQTLAQRRAQHALKQVLKHRQAGPREYGNYVSYVQALPATIVMNGLGQACAMLLAKAAGDPKQPHGLLYADLEDWLCGPDEAAPFRNAPKTDYRLMNAITSGDQRAYVRAQAEAIAYLGWLKKFACAFLERGAEE